MVDRKKRPEADAVINGMPEAVVIVDLNGTIHQVNNEFERGSGWKKEEVIGKTSIELDLISKEEGQKIEKEIMPKLMKEGLVRDIEITVIRRDGTKFPALMSWTLINDAEGQPTGIIGVSKDITERKRAEEALQESEKRYRDLLENANDIIQSVYPSGKFAYVNRKWLEVLEYTKDEVEKLTLWDILRKDQIPHCMEIFKRVSSGEEVTGVETVFVSKNGKEINVEGNANAYFKGGKFVATRGIFRDITERKRAEEALRVSEEKLSAFINSAPDAFALFDSELNLVETNKVGLGMFPAGTKKEDVIGKNITELYPNMKETNRYDKYLGVIKTGKPFFIDDVVPHPKFGDVHLAVSAFKVGDGLGIIVTDTTERKTYEIDQLKEGRISVATESIASRMTAEFGLNVGSEELGLLDIFTHLAQLSPSPAPRRIISFLETGVCRVLRQKGVKVSKDRVQKILRPAIKGFLKNIFALERELGHELPSEYKKLITLYE